MKIRPEPWRTRQLAARARMDRIVRGSGRRCGARRAPQRSFRSPAVDGQAGSSRPVKHSPAFLKLVDDAKTRVREIDVDETRKRLEAGGRDSSTCARTTSGPPVARGAPSIWAGE